ncbi:MAG TPA: ROK family transcriptional regulator [Terrimesophilobacter sp.]|nr:ROK family transcriptional regulator [Terrimesophilobacter sp.]
MVTRNKVTATTSTVSKVNRTAIIEALIEHGPISRRQIGVLTGLSPATVNRLTGNLIAEDLVTQHGQEASTGGRPSILLRYTGSSRVVAGMQIRHDRASGILVDFDGVIIHSQECLFDIAAAGGIDQVGQQTIRLEKTIELFDSLIAAAARLGSPCLSIGVAVPGVVQEPDGRLGSIPELGWPEVALGAILRERTSIPVIIENDANALAVGELHRGAAQGVSNLVAIVLETGLGTGIITNGKLYRGHAAQAGEIGYMLMDRSALGKMFPQRGDLELRLGSVAMTRQAREQGLSIPDAELLSAQQFFALARSGDAIAGRVVAEFLDILSLAIAAMTSVLSPELVVLGGGLAADADTLIPGIRERLIGRIPRIPSIVPAAHVEDAVMMGAAELAARTVNGFTYVAQ